jgi:hypothetical protein
MKEIFDKILFTVLASLLSTYVLYSYNVYGKAFDASQAQSHSYSTLAHNLYSLVISDSFKAVREVKANYLSGERPLNQKWIDELDRLGDEIQLTASIFGEGFEEPKTIALQIAKLLRDYSLSFSTKQNFTLTNVAEFTDKVRGAQAQFIRAYNGSIGSLISSETKAFEKSFDANIPWQANPITMLYAALAGIVAYLVYALVANDKSCGNSNIT